MMRLTISFPSTTLLRPVEIQVGLPSGFSTARPPYRTLWALHCAMESGVFFFESLDAAGIADREQVAIVAPSLGNGYFINSVAEAQGDFLQEMFIALHEILPLSSRKEDNVVLGVSMGAFGALRWGLECRCFARVAAVSGVFDALLPPDERLMKKRAQRALYLSIGRVMQRLLLDADGRTRPEADFPRLLQATGTDFPQIYLYCGEEDYLSLSQTDKMEELCRHFACPVQRHVSAGEHDAAYWRGIFPRAVNELFAN
ncbi:MAG TPA: hypothetical protein H9768_11305 [Candidatus Mailhella merdavium]|nr:hypothetical protein [Candidatus Mailhella merdavium]